jgi:hypothetical protein
MVYDAAADVGAGEDAAGSYAMREERAASPPPPAPRRRARRVEDDEDHPRPRRRRRRGGSFFADWGVGKILLTVAGGVWLLLLGGAFLFPPCAIVLIVLGFLMAVAARIWMIVAAFGEDAGTGCLVVALPWYGLWSLEDQRPLLLLGAGLLFVVSGIGVLFVDHLLGVI